MDKSAGISHVMTQVRQHFSARLCGQVLTVYFILKYGQSLNQVPTGCLCEFCETAYRDPYTVNPDPCWSTALEVDKGPASVMCHFGSRQCMMRFGIRARRLSGSEAHLSNSYVRIRVLCKNEKRTINIQAEKSDDLVGRATAPAPQVLSPSTLFTSATLQIIICLGLQRALMQFDMFGDTAASKGWVV